MIDDLETALEVEAARAGSTTGEATSVLDAVPPPQRKLSARGRWSWAGIAAAAAWSPAARCSAVELISSGEVGGGGGGERRRAKHGRARLGDRLRPAGRRRGGLGARSSCAIDGNPTGTAWDTEHYDYRRLRRDEERAQPGRRPLRRPPSRRRRRRRSIVRSPDPGWDAEVYAAAAGAAGRARRLGLNRSARSTTPRTARTIDARRVTRPPATSCSGSPRPPPPATRPAATRSRSPTSQLDRLSAELASLARTRASALARGARPPARRGGRRAPGRRCRSPRRASRRRWSR